jgi:superfamily II DNA/RNA helicase
VRVEVSKPATTVSTITQALTKSGREPHDKRDVLRRLIRSENLKNAIIFCNRKRDVATLHRSLLRHGFSVQALHGDMDQSARTAALEQFRKGDVSLLVASDVAARGLDIPDVSHVFNFDVPIHADDYVHRIGRTGRAGKSGTAITLVAGSNDAKAVAAIEKLIGQSIPWLDKALSEPAEPQPESQPAPRSSHPSRGSRGRANGQRHQSHRPTAPRSEDARPRRAPQPQPSRSDESDSSHLPAFLLRPFTVKA